jgi:hypothetical protein
LVQKHTMIPETIYQQRIVQFQAQIAVAKSLSSWLSLGRLLCFLAAVCCAYLYFWYDMEPLWLLGILAGFSGFVFFIARYQKAQDHLRLLRVLLQLNEKELLQVTTHQSTFEDGSRFIDEQHDFSGDLDVFGPSSLYQYINRTGSYSGAVQLAEALQFPLEQAREIAATQQAVAILKDKVDFRQLLTAQATLSDERAVDKQAIRHWLQIPFEFLPVRYLEVLCWVMPALLWASIIYLIYGGSQYPMFIMIAVNMGILRKYSKNVKKQHEWISGKDRILQKFSQLLLLIKNESFGDSALLLEQQALASAAAGPLAQLSRISNALNQRNNMAIGLVLNLLFLYELHCLFSLEKWKKRNEHQLDGWLEVVARMEVWNSFSTFAFNHPQYVYPVINEQEVALKATGLGHPLIAPEECVTNDCTIGQQAHFLIITGSNMSGKSTFLRSVGSNLLLAMCGAPVCATTFSCSPMHMMTSMRIKDSIARHTSYFQAELLRLQHIIKVLKSGRRVFIILDEILKGTNSEDKLSGSRSLIEHFLQYNCLGMIATHDLELGHLETEHPAEIKNYCFESTIQDNHLYFDYLIREGIARNKNATFLMKQMRII